MYILPMKIDAKMEISFTPEILPCFYSIFQRGFLFSCKVERSIEHLLLHQLELDPKFVKEKVSTVFLDGSCVDDISSAILKEGSTVAFSSALPGLAGATLRRGGHYACLRESITHKEQSAATEAEHEGLITVKLFNILMGGMGGVFLEKGIILGRNAATEFFTSMSKDLLDLIDKVEIRGAILSLETFLKEQPLVEYDQIMIRAIKDGRSVEKKGWLCDAVVKELPPCM
jgi:hypothetical protein